jgi:hypothetical protein
MTNHQLPGHLGGGDSLLPPLSQSSCWQVLLHWLGVRGSEKSVRGPCSAAKYDAGHLSASGALTIVVYR